MFQFRALMADTRRVQHGFQPGSSCTCSATSDPISVYSGPYIGLQLTLYPYTPDAISV